ncbi:hypothetical protein EC973_003396 [Apophysomyces ossiformis]|uniref:ER membrane protein complex subunit 1 n=1 Tax=Apophysomyces ossiformis TaxID=679940 RepID=A0A8H7BTQ6_9FUNG|nr:hypothetical protein EC973_003396 [Apophysomyces ossiformis]
MDTTKYRRKACLLTLGLLYVFLCVTPVSAIYQSEAGVFDWHHSWVGKARQALLLNTTHLAVSTDRNVLASLEVETGTIAWRQLLDEPIVDMKVSDKGVLTVGGRVRLWDSKTGRLVWELASSSNASSAAWHNDGVLVADQAHITMTSIDGKELWKLENEGEPIAIYSQEDALYIINRQQNELQIKSVDDSGAIVKKISLPYRAVSDAITISNKYLIWIEDGSLKWNRIGTKKVLTKQITSMFDQSSLFKSAITESLRTVTAKAEFDTFFITSFVEIGEDAVAKTSAACRISDDGNQVVLIQDFGLKAGFDYVDSLDESIVRFARTSDSSLVVDLITSDATSTSGQVSIQHDFKLTGDIALAKLLHSSPFRTLIITTSGSMFMYDEENIVWSREEALAHTTASEFLDLPEKQLWTQMADELSESAEEQMIVHPLTRYVRRLKTHFAELRDLPSWISSRLASFSASQKQDIISLSDAQSCWKNSTAESEILYRDNFGLRKLLISVTSTGKIIAQDSASKGTIVWSRYFDNVEFKHVVVVRALAVKFPPLIVAIGEKIEDGYGTMHFYRLNALNGQDYISSIPNSDEFFEPQLVTESRISKVMRLPIEEPEERTHILALYEPSTTRVYIYPDTPSAREAFQRFRPQFYFVYQGKDGSFGGFQVKEGYRGSLTASSVWTLDLPAEETITAVSDRQPYEKVALLGRVLGNRNVLYKYLNPHLFAVATINASQQSLTIRLVDAVKGAILYETTHSNTDINNQVHIVQSENWVVYHYWSDDARSRGYQAVVLELFEGQNENERVVSTNFSSFANAGPYVRSSSFAFPHAVNTIGVTTTRNGISTRAILFGLPTHQIMAVNKRLLDPRRPTDKPSKDDQEEALIPYAPIADERRSFLTYSLEVIGIQHIITAPALLESTSLVFAYGLDTFFSKSSPSRQFDVLSEEFSKSQLLLTIAGLIGGILVAGPMVRRKRINALWM